MKVAVIGAGVAGLAATFELREMGAEVTCFEQTAAMSQRSAGATRIFRYAHSTPELVALAMRAHERYRAWEQRYGQPLITRGGLAISGPRAQQWQQAMAAAGAPHRMASPDDVLRLPTSQPPSSVVIDESGGALQAARIGEFLSTAAGGNLVIAGVKALEEGPHGVRVRGAEVDTVVDAVLICAGAGTPALAAQVGLQVPSRFAHHLRLSFALPPGLDPLPSWIGVSGKGLATYQHHAGAGRWAVGAHFAPADVSVELGAAHTAQLTRAAILDYVRTELDQLDPHIVDELPCIIDPERGDGFEFRRAGRVLAVYGENLFKLAPLLGWMLARAALDGSTPASVNEPQEDAF